MQKRMKLAAVVAITVGFISAMVGFASADAATGTDFTEVRDGVAIVHTGTTGVIDLNSFLSEGEWACKSSPSTEEFYSFVDTDLNYMVVGAWLAGEHDASWKSCSDEQGAVKHSLSVQAYDVDMMSAHYDHKNVKKKTFAYEMPNDNSPVRWANGDVALNNNATCMTGDFSKPAPERTFPVAAGAVKGFTSKLGPKKLDYICFADDEAVMAYHDSSMSEGMRRGVATSVTAWGRTFGSRPHLG